MKILSVYIFLFCCLYTFSLPAYSATETELLTKMENNIFGFDYSNDNNNNRVSRLEKTIYGKISAGDINKRIKKLSGDIAADVIGLEIEPSEDTFLAEENAKEDSSVDYPIVDEIEKKLFNQTYKNRDFHTRIVTIEKKLFGKIYDIDDYSTRMDRIKSKIMPEVITKKESDNFDSFGDGSYYDHKTLSAMDFSGGKLKNFKMPFGQKNYTRPYTNFGNIIPEHNMNDDFNYNPQLNEELAQLEYDTFGTEFSNESTQSRIKRLNSVNKAKKSSRKYDSQKFSQHMSTAMEIGAMILMILAMVL